MELKTPKDLINIAAGEMVSKDNLSNLIQYSKVIDSDYWGGSDYIIGNTPQQGINWVGTPPNIRAVIIKTKEGSYDTDGWADGTRDRFHYSFKARKGVVNYSERANDALIKQPQYGYPIMLFVEARNEWLYEGSFDVISIEDRFVALQRSDSHATSIVPSQDEYLFQEGGKKYVTHLMTERSKEAITMLKATHEWVCEICGINFAGKYGVQYIEAHHKTPISSYSSEAIVSLSDFALLCPNCHKAVHIYMKNKKLDFIDIKTMLKRA